MTHDLKTWPKFYDLMEAGKKNFELRKDDRDFKEGDILNLIEYDPKKGWLDRSMKVEVTTVVRNVPEFGLKKGYCILSTKRVGAIFN